MTDSVYAEMGEELASLSAKVKDLTDIAEEAIEGWEYVSLCCGYTKEMVQAKKLRERFKEVLENE